MIRRSGIAKHEIDGLAVSSYLMGPDNGASLTEVFGLSPRFLIDFPYGGACGILALKRAARAVQNGDAEIVACLAGDIALHGYGFNANFSTFSRDHVYPYGGGGMNAVFALITRNYMRDIRRAAGGLRPRFASPSGRIVPVTRSRLFKKPLTVDEPISTRARDLRAAGAVRLRAAGLRRRGLPGDESRTAPVR